MALAAAIEDVIITTKSPFSEEDVNRRYANLIHTAKYTPVGDLIATVVDVVNSGRLENPRLINTLHDLCVDLILGVEFQVFYDEGVVFNVGFDYPGKSTPNMILSKNVNKIPVLNAILQNSVTVEVYNDKIAGVNGVKNPTMLASGDYVRVRRSDINFLDNLEQLFLVTAAIKRM